MNPLDHERFSQMGGNGPPGPINRNGLVSSQAATGKVIPETVAENIKECFPLASHPCPHCSSRDQSCANIRNAFQRVACRWRARLLEPFECFACGALALDPCGRFGKRQFLCSNCADGGMP